MKPSKIRSYRELELAKPLINRVIEKKQQKKKDFKELWRIMLIVDVFIYIFKILQEVIKMNKSELIAAIATKTGETKKDAEATLNAFVNVVSETLAKGDKVQLVGFGSFEVRKRAARKGRNPQTKEEIKIPASKAPVFKAGKALKDLVNKK